MKNAVIEWTLDLQREGGGELLISEIKGIEIAVSGDNGNNWSVLPTLFPAATLTTTIEDMDAGDYLCRGVVVDTLNQRSQPIVEPFVIADTSPPNPLGSLTVTLN